MLRNQDRPELLIFVGAGAARWSDGTERPGVARLVGEAADVGTPSVWLAEGAVPLEGLDAAPWPADAPPMPCPQALQDARAAVEVQPDAFGGSDGLFFSVETKDGPRRLAATT